MAEVMAAAAKKPECSSYAALISEIVSPTPSRLLASSVRISSTSYESDLESQIAEVYHVL